MTLLTTPIFGFHQVISSLMTPTTTPTPTPSLVKTSLKKKQEVENVLLRGVAIINLKLLATEGFNY